MVAMCHYYRVAMNFVKKIEFISFQTDFSDAQFFCFGKIANIMNLTGYTQRLKSFIIILDYSLNSEVFLVLKGYVVDVVC